MTRFVLNKIANTFQEPMSTTTEVGLTEDTPIEITQKDQKTTSTLSSSWFGVMKILISFTDSRCQKDMKEL